MVVVIWKVREADTSVCEMFQKELQMKYINIAKGGGSNKRILRTQ